MKSEAKITPATKPRSVAANLPKPPTTLAGPDKTLTAINLKTTLWETLNDIKGDKMLPGQGDAIAAQAREILRTIKVQLQIAGQSKRQVPIEIIDFSESVEKR